MFSLEPAQPLHETMLGVLHEARRRRMPHAEYSLPVCELLLEIHTPTGTCSGSPAPAATSPGPGPARP
ncbi:hypothetical protein [Sinomonas atrocyanea]